ncbi:MAG: non-reducing end alpha-L-arabinofuranosidase family hydrolase [Bacteroidota bacterium]
MKQLILAASVILSIVTSSCDNDSHKHNKCEKQPEFQYEKWTVSNPVFTKGKEGTMDDASVKDPTIVFYNGKYHLFYTTKALRKNKHLHEHITINGSGLGYVAAPTIEELNTAKRHNMNEINEYEIVAPQVFYFEPQKLWYIVAHTLVEGRPDLMPIYMTNPNIEDVNGWAKPKPFNLKKMNDGFWIDFWVITDEEKAHLFYTDHEGSMFRFETALQDFPNGFNRKEETVLTIRGEDEKGIWRMHEASHIYYVKKEKKYLALLECVRPHPLNQDYWDSRVRFHVAVVADKLEGPWERVETENNDFMGDPDNLYYEDGTKCVYDNVSHPELIRGGYDSKLEIEDYNLQMLIQSFDAEKVPDNYDYNDLPYELAIMKNY